MRGGGAICVGVAARPSHWLQWRLVLLVFVYVSLSLFPGKCCGWVHTDVVGHVMRIFVSPCGVSIGPSASPIEAPRVLTLAR